ncbi:MBL fold metallo-hydrolase [Nakamurella flava]|uniref:MBL fold metallo-hydrolase n=1 Tax=Nakamurella flava TaxID=2576308 RepID=A0A4V6CS15_9ACTN|nr:MBL fold metallo-hydrolase [Nakamurella flava]TKV58435.1 MBL fold metallo-hydrolase [Nakamurella flava]
MIGRRWDVVIAREDLSVLVTTSRRELTTSTLLLAGPVGAAAQALVVDPAWDPDELDGLAGDLAGWGVTDVSGIATHAHYDHLLWHPGLGRGPRWSSATTAATAGRDRDTLVAALGPDFPADLAALVGRVRGRAPGPLPWSGPPVELVEHDAHTPGHLAVWLPDPGVLIAGDMLSDVEPPLPEETGPAEYRAGLDVLAPFVERTSVVVPGHGHVGDGAEARRRWTADAAAVADLTN